jgi:hypothetical protein
LVATPTGLEKDLEILSWRDLDVWLTWHGLFILIVSGFREDVPRVVPSSIIPLFPVI